MEVRGQAVRGVRGHPTLRAEKPSGVGETSDELRKIDVTYSLTSTCSGVFMEETPVIVLISGSFRLSLPLASLSLPPPPPPPLSYPPVGSFTGCLVGPVLEVIHTHRAEKLEAQFRSGRPQRGEGGGKGRGKKWFSVGLCSVFSVLSVCLSVSVCVWCVCVHVCVSVCVCEIEINTSNVQLTVVV